jgi:hypothetical protein
MFRANILAIGWASYPGLILVGIGMTVSIPPLTITVFDSAPDEKSGTASGVNNAAARGGKLVAVAALGLAFGGSGLSSKDADAITVAIGPSCLEQRA